jgi:hypothetical protein
MQGKTVLMLPRPQMDNGIDITHLSPGSYFLQLTDEKTRKVTVQKFTKI